jgi:hypothetical protein
MPGKIGRNDPCWCGSGKKYKRCCMDSDNTALDKASSMFGRGGVNRLSLMRTVQRLCNDQKQMELFERVIREADCQFGTENFKDFLLKSWTLDRIKKMDTGQIIEKLKSMNLEFEIEDFKKQAQNYVSAIALAEDHYYTQQYYAHDRDEDFIWMAVIELWNRIIPERYSAEMIDDLMQGGYDDIENDNYREAMAKWEKAWNMVTSIIPPDIKSIIDADMIIPQLTQKLYNWCQDFQMELGNVAIDGRDPDFYARRIKYCQEFCRSFPYSDQLIIQNMLRAEAESHTALGM